MTKLARCLFCNEPADPTIRTLVNYCRACWEQEPQGVRERMERDYDTGKPMLDLMTELVGPELMEQFFSMDKEAAAVSQEDSLGNRVFKFLLASYPVTSEQDAATVVLAFQLGLQIADVDPVAAQQMLVAIQEVGAKIGGIPLSRFRERDREEALGMIDQLDMYSGAE